MQAVADAAAPPQRGGTRAGGEGRPSGSAPDGGRPRPLLRGVSHEIFFFVSLVTGPLLGLAAPTTGARLCVSVYALSTTAMLGTSALFHRPRWSPAARKRMRRADH